MPGWHWASGMIAAAQRPGRPSAPPPVARRRVPTAQSAPSTALGRAGTPQAHRCGRRADWTPGRRRLTGIEGRDGRLGSGFNRLGSGWFNRPADRLDRIGRLAGIVGIIGVVGVGWRWWAVGLVPSVWAAVRVAGSATTCTTAFFVGAGRPAAGQSACPQAQASSAPAASAVRASARRSGRVRGSASHTERAISSTRASINAASGAYSRAHMLVIPAGSSGLPNSTVREDTAGPGTAQRGGVVALHQRVDGVFGFGDRQRPPPAHPIRQFGVHGGHRLGVEDQGGAIHDRAHQQVTDQPGLKQRRHLG